MLISILPRHYSPAGAVGAVAQAVARAQAQPLTDKQAHGIGWGQP